MNDAPSSSRGPGPVVWITSLAAAAALGFLVHSLVTGPGDLVEGPPPGPVEPTSPSPAEPPSAPPPTEADRLFDESMRALAAGDTAGALTRIPAAIEAYGSSDRLDADDVFHLALLREAAGDLAGARAASERVLAEMPSHLLHLSVLARTSEALGDSTAARAAWSRFLEAYEAERADPRPEYEAHAALLPDLKAEAEQGLDR